MKNVIWILMFLSLSAFGAEQSEIDGAQMDACAAFFNWRATQPACDEIVTYGKNHTVNENEYRSHCSMSAQFKRNAESAAARYQKLTKHQVIISECPASAAFN